MLIQKQSHWEWRKYKVVEEFEVELKHNNYQWWDNICSQEVVNQNKVFERKRTAHDLLSTNLQAKQRYWLLSLYTKGWG